MTAYQTAGIGKPLLLMFEKKINDVKLLGNKVDQRLLAIVADLEPGQDSELFVYFVYKVLDDGYSCQPSAAAAFLFLYLV